jgi:PAT family acetyl-CoA transporter-like MFS transporter 1
LLSKGATLNDLMIISLSYIPFCFKSFISPILNTYFFKKFGRGKTYLVPGQYLIGLTILYMASQGEKLFEIQSIPKLNIIAILVVLFAIPVDISLDGWMVTLISTENSSYGVVAMTLGYNLGNFIAFNLFMPLTSLEFCNNYIYSTPQSTPLISTASYIAFIACIILAVNFWAHFFVVEKEPEGHKNPGSVKEVLKTLEIFVTNPYFRKLFFLFSTWNIIFGPIHNLFGSIVIEKGVSKELFTNINSPITPILFVVTFWLGGLCKRIPETKVAIMFWIFRLFATFISFGTIIYFTIIPEQIKIPLLFLSLFLSSITYNGICIALGGFASRIAKETYGGPIMSTFGAIGCVHRLLGDIFIYTLINFVDWNTLAVGTLVGMFAYAVVFMKWLQIFEGKDLKTLVKEKAKLE